MLMTTFLSLNSSLRLEDDAETIATLKRKGWTETAPPANDATTQHAPVWSEGAWVIRDKNAEELSASARKTWPSSAAFLSEFTVQEIAAVQLSTDPTVAAMTLILATWDKEVWSDDPRIIAGMSAVVSAGILSQERASQILAK